jgi:hypothetical protein
LKEITGNRSRITANDDNSAYFGGRCSGGRVECRVDFKGGKLRISSGNSVYVTFEVFTALTIKNAVFWEIIASLYLTGDLLRLCYRAQPSQLMLCKNEVLTAVTIKNAAFRDVTPCGSCKNRYLKGTYRLNQQGKK